MAQVIDGGVIREPVRGTVRSAVRFIVQGLRNAYTYNGTNGYATLNTDWTPSAFPWSRSLKCIPETVDSTVRHLDGGATLGIFLNASNQLSATFIDEDNATTRTVTGPVVGSGAQLNITLLATDTATVLIVNDSETDSGFVAATASQQAISTLAALATPASFFHGPIWDYMLTDAADSRFFSGDEGSGDILFDSLNPLGPDLVLAAKAANWDQSSMGTNTIVDDGDLAADEVLVTFGNTNAEPRWRINAASGSVGSDLTIGEAYNIRYKGIQVTGGNTIRVDPGNFDSVLTPDFVDYTAIFIATTSSGNALRAIAFSSGDAYRVKSMEVRLYANGNTHATIQNFNQTGWSL